MRGAIPGAQNLRFATVSRDPCERVHPPKHKCASHYSAVHSKMWQCVFRYSGVRKNVWIYRPSADLLRTKKKVTFYHSFERLTPRFWREGCATANQFCVSLQFWAIDTTFLTRGLPTSKIKFVSLQFWAIDTTVLTRGLRTRESNLHFATVLGDRHHVLMKGLISGWPPPSWTCMFTRGMQSYAIKSCKEIEASARFFYCHSRRVAMIWNDMQWFDIHCHSCWCNDMQGYVLHSHTLPFLLMHWYARICFAFTYIAIPADALICKDMFCIHIHSHSCWCIPCEWRRIEWIRIEWLRMILGIEWIRIGEIRIDRIRVEWICIQKICVEWCLLICMVWHTPTIFWRTLRRNVFRETYNLFFFFNRFKHDWFSTFGGTEIKYVFLDNHLQTSFVRVHTHIDCFDRLQNIL